jgi:glyoxylase-like metal-dependent hydrolase (beta-lactamase superfamily II)
MLHLQSFVFNAFQENTYVLYDDTKQCVIIDPGCYAAAEQQQLANFIESNKLTPVKLLNTHCHIDHILGNNFVSKKFNIGLEIHEADLPTLLATTEYGHLYGFTVDPSPQPTRFIQNNETITFGNTDLEVRFTPGHAPGHVVFIHHNERFVINGDVLFYNSIGRTDLPGGDHNTLIKSIHQELFTLPDDYIVYTGHGPSTTIGEEKKNNPFVGLS